LTYFGIAIFNQLEDWIDEMVLDYFHYAVGLYLGKG